MATKAKAQVKTTEKKETVKRVRVPQHKQSVTEAPHRKNIVKSVSGKASSVRDENGKKMNRLHIVKYTQNKKPIAVKMRIVYGKELLSHTEKNVLELTNARGSVYYFIPVK